MQHQLQCIFVACTQIKVSVMGGTTSWEKLRNLGKIGHKWGTFLSHATRSTFTCASHSTRLVRLFATTVISTPRLAYIFALSQATE
jgi:hypothetical protein